MKIIIHTYICIINLRIYFDCVYWFHWCNICTYTYIYTYVQVHRYVYMYICKDMLLYVVLSHKIPINFVYEYIYVIMM